MLYLEKVKTMLLLLCLDVCCLGYTCVLCVCTCVFCVYTCVVCVYIYVICVYSCVFCLTITCSFLLMYKGTLEVNDSSVNISYPRGEYSIRLLDHLMVCVYTVLHVCMVLYNCVQCTIYVCDVLSVYM